MVRLFCQINNSTNVEELLSFPNINFNELNNNVDANIAGSEEVESESDDEVDVLDEVDEKIEEELAEISKFNFSNSTNTEYFDEEIDTVNDVNFEYQNEYDFSRGHPIETLNIDLGSD